jgi:hypothetical protein
MRRVEGGDTTESETTGTGIGTSTETTAPSIFGLLVFVLLLVFFIYLSPRFSGLNLERDQSIPVH